VTGHDVPRRAALSGTLRALWRRLRGEKLTPGRAAASVALGIFVGCLPLYGFQFWLALAVALPLKLDYPLALLSTLVANPVTMPFLIVLEVEIGALIVEGHWLPFSLSAIRQNWVGALGYATLGSILLGALLAGLGAGIVSLWVKIRLKRAALGRQSRPVPSSRPSAR
jgi:uncharacterized protein (DUF2062 family)